MCAPSGRTYEVLAAHGGRVTPSSCVRCLFLTGASSSALQLILSQRSSQQGHCKDVVVHKPFVSAQSAETSHLPPILAKPKASRHLET